MPYTYRRSPYARATRLPYTGGYRGRARRPAYRRATARYRSTARIARGRRIARRPSRRY